VAAVGVGTRENECSRWRCLVLELDSKDAVGVCIGTGLGLCSCWKYNHYNSEGQISTEIRKKTKTGCCIEVAEPVSGVTREDSGINAPADPLEPT
jgi:hypothetical protein